MDVKFILELEGYLQEACKNKFGFEPNRVKESMEFMEEDPEGIYRFRHGMCKAIMELSFYPLDVFLYERNGIEGNEWDDLLMDELRETDEAVNDKKARYQALLDSSHDFLNTSPVWHTHKKYISSLFRDDISYLKNGPSPMVGTRQLVEGLLSSKDPDIQELVNFYKTNDVNELSNWILIQYHYDIEAEYNQSVMANIKFQQLTWEINKRVGEPTEQAYALAKSIHKELPAHLIKHYDSTLKEMMLFAKASKIMP